MYGEARFGEYVARVSYDFRTGTVAIGVWRERERQQLQVEDGIIRIDPDIAKAVCAALISAQLAPEEVTEEPAAVREHLADARAMRDRLLSIIETKLSIGETIPPAKDTVQM